MAGTDYLTFLDRMKTKMKHVSILAEISIGEFIDKITILQIKSERIRNPDKLGNIQRELDVLNRIRIGTLVATSELSEIEAELKNINEIIWILEDDVRDHEHRNDFGASFVSLARSIYKANDRRARLKHQINELMGSNIIEEKSYAEY